MRKRKNCTKCVGAAEGGHAMSTYLMLRAILIILCLDHILIALGLIAWLIFRKEQ